MRSQRSETQEMDGPGIMDTFSVLVATRRRFLPAYAEVSSGVNAVPRTPEHVGRLSELTRDY